MTATMTPADMKRARALLQWTQADLAHALEVHPVSIAKLETGVHPINRRTEFAVKHLLRARGLTLDGAPPEHADPHALTVIASQFIRRHPWTALALWREFRREGDDVAADAIRDEVRLSAATARRKRDVSRRVRIGRGLDAATSGDHRHLGWR